MLSVRKTGRQSERERKRERERERERERVFQNIVRGKPNTCTDD